MSQPLATYTFAVPSWPSLARFHLLFSLCCGNQSNAMVSLLQQCKMVPFLVQATQPVQFLGKNMKRDQKHNSELCDFS